MSLRPEPVGEIPAETARVARAAFPKGSVVMRLRDEFNALYQDEDFRRLDIIGLYLTPPDRALVFSVDEKSQIQALDRTQPGLPLKKGRCGTMTHDYKRHGCAFRSIVITPSGDPDHSGDDDVVGRR